MDYSTRSRRALRVVIASVIATAMLALAAGPATAQVTDPTDAQYSDNIVASGVSGGGGGEQNSTGSAAGGGTGSAASGLPFTGLDLALASVVGALLIGTGLVMRRASSSQAGV